MANVQNGSTKKKVNLIIIIVVVAACLALSIYGSVHFGIITVMPDDFLEAIRSSGVYDNTLDDLIPQTALYNMIADHFSANTSGKTPMLLFIGYDGCVANAVPMMKERQRSAIFENAASGGLYLTYCGGEKVGDQATSTAPGWASIFTGKWAKEHGVKGNSDTLSTDTETILLRLSSGGLTGQKVGVSYTYIWDPHEKVTYKKEIAKAKANGYKITYTDGKTDDDTENTVTGRLMSSDDQAIFCILEATDAAGHSSGFSTNNKKYMNGINDLEDRALRLIDTMKARATYDSEDWLVILTTDHGGRLLSHGGKSVMERVTWFSTNKG